MTSKEIRNEVSPMVIWMADAAIRGACMAINDNNSRLPAPYNRIDGESEILFAMFNICIADAKEALIKVANGHDGLCEYPNFNYFDSLVEFLNKERYGNATLRKPDWILEKK